MANQETTLETSADQLAKAGIKQATAKRKIFFASSGDLNKSESDDREPLSKSIVNTLQDLARGKKINRIGFTEDPTSYNKYISLYRPKSVHQAPDWLLKQIVRKSDVVNVAVRTRASQLSAFGHPLKDRHDIGVRIEPRKGVLARPELDKAKLQDRIDKATKLLLGCGHTDNLDNDDHMSLSQFLYQQGRNAVIFGRFATEMTYVGVEGKELHSFRPLDAGTIFHAKPYADGAQKIRKDAQRKLEELAQEDMHQEPVTPQDFAYFQVVNGMPQQAFTHKELIVHNVFPVTDIETSPYPSTPIDGAIDAIITQMAITAHNKLYFQSGRAARGMVVIKSADVNQDIADQIREHFNSSINSVENSWRVPVFGVDPNDDVSWEPLEFQGSRDQEFQYLADSVVRTVFGAFQMAPDEVPGYTHLSKPTGPQGLSESDNEWKLEAARDVGLRPLVLQFQAFLNDEILPLLDAGLGELAEIQLVGLEGDSPERENARLQAQMGIHSTYDEVRTQVEKQALGKQWGGELPLNAAVMANWDKYFYVGDILEKQMGIPNASQDPKNQYRRDPFFFNWIQLQMQKEQMSQQQEMLQQQATQEQSSPQNAKEDGSKADSNEGGELASGIDQALELLGKSERNLHPNKRKILAQHAATVKLAMDEWEKESQKALEEIVTIAKKRTPKKS
jgi:hypothetical protein